MPWLIFSPFGPTTDKVLSKLLQFMLNLFWNLYWGAFEKSVKPDETKFNLKNLICVTPKPIMNYSYYCVSNEMENSITE